jgi:hypothetical protein
VWKILKNARLDPALRQSGPTWRQILSDTYRDRLSSCHPCACTARHPLAGSPPIELVP